jgi:hypothetical protein
MSKVYCGKCIHFFYDSDICRHPTNIVQHEITNWRSFRVENRQAREPSDINKHNDCPLYQIKVVPKYTWWDEVTDAFKRSL